MNCKTCKLKASTKQEQIKTCKECLLKDQLREEIKLKGQCLSIDLDNFIEGWNARGKYE